ncbi:hypothetical protein BD410DRAFT_794319 [Rickenella mellea]|uniref:F-box domain-containing protein n=1 Tax=Rickenella mellea TaxID=50990 RepID=A0A4Y7PR43_9AGAM|nr:hypothetical protein BD410DRAFT_794319 [Rickenella mellea]
MQRLPDDVLREVFEAGLAMPYIFPCLPASGYPIRLTHVCRRFRLVAFSTPRLWTKLENDFPPDQLHAYIRRSRAADLTLSLQFGVSAGRTPCSVAEFWKSRLHIAIVGVASNASAQG